MATLQQLETALINADKAGDMDAARQLAAVIQRGRQDIANQVPDADVQETIQRPADPTLGEQVVGVADAAASAVPMAVFGGAGMIGGTLKGMAQQLLSGEFGSQQASDAVQKAAMEGAEAFAAPFAPETQAGRDVLQSVGETLAPAVAATPFGAEIGAITKGVTTASPLARGVAGKAVAPIQQAASKITEAIRPAAADVQSGASGARSGGAAAVEAGTLRQARADELPTPIKLTEGQKTRDFGQQRFERETAKDPEMGEPIRQRLADQNQQLQQNLDQFIDSTGGEAPDLRSLGESVTKAIGLREKRHKARIRDLYKKATDAGDLEEKVTLPQVIDHINKSGPEAANANILEVARRKALQTGAAVEAEDGSLIANPVSLKNAEEFRKTLNGAAGIDPVNIRQASIMKGLIDESTDGVGGQAYRKARAARARYAKDYENIGLIDNLIGTKRGTNDRSIALEDVLRKSVIDPSTSLDTVKQLRRVLNTQGETGRQAWRDVQGAAVQHIKDEALKNVSRDERGNPIVSAAALDRVVKALDKNEKLQFIFGKKMAEQIRTINDVAKDVLVAPPGAVNTSNTASVLAGLMDVMISGTSGVPAPVMTSLRLATKSIKDAKTRARVRKALGVTKKDAE
jgi:hypothetical protein